MEALDNLPKKKAESCVVGTSEKKNGPKIVLPRKRKLNGVNKNITEKILNLKDSLKKYKLKIKKLVHNNIGDQFSIKNKLSG